MCINITYNLGLKLGTCDGVIIPEGAPFWEIQDDGDAMYYLRDAREAMKDAYDIERLYWYLSNDDGKWRAPYEEAIPKLLGMTERMPSNRLAGKQDLQDAERLRIVIEKSQKRKAGKKQRTRSGFVYVLRGAGYYKIGLSKNVDRRMEQIEPKLPFETELLCTIATDDMHRLESELHKRFADKRASGEWFQLTENDVEYIKSL